MEITRECEREIERIKATMSCPKNFHCEKVGFENLSPVKIYEGANIIQCDMANASGCAQSSVLSPFEIAFCMCPLRKYLALQQLDR